MENREIQKGLEKIENEISKLFDLLREHNTDVNDVKVKLGQMEVKIKMLEGKSGNTRANIALAITIIYGLAWLVTLIVKEL
jgi:peptidoglycan hydrolase CwlO-like protein